MLVLPGEGTCRGAITEGVAMSMSVDEQPGAGNDPRIGPLTRLIEAARIGQLPRHEISSGVIYVQLWSDGRSYAGKMWIGPDAQLATHTHRRHAHHVWVLDGVVTALGRRLPAGSYAYVPPTQPHDLAAGPDGATVFYLHLQTVEHEDRPDDG
jgi:hypothetical protein